MLRYFRSQPLLGLDLGFDQLRLLQFEKRRKGLSFVKTKKITINPPALSLGDSSRWELIQDCLANWVKQTKAQGRAVALAIPSHALQCKTIQLSTDFSQQQLTPEIVRLLPIYFPNHLAEELSFDFSVLRTTAEFYEVALVAAEREYLQSYVHAVTQAGLKVAFVDGEMYALARAAKAGLNYLNENTAQTAALFYLQDTEFQLLVYQQKNIIFHRVFTIDAEANKANNNLLQSFKQAWVQALSKHPSLKISALTLAGANDYLAELCEQLQAEFSVPTSLAFIPCVCVESKIDTSFLLAYGLAIREPSLCWN